MLGRLVGGDDNGPLLVAFTDQLEEERGRLLGEFQIAQLVNDQEIKSRQILQEFDQASGHIGGGQIECELFGCGKENTLALLTGLEAEGDGQMGLAHAGRAEEEDVPGLLQEVERGQLPQELLIELGLIAPVEGVQVAEHREARGLDTVIDGAVDFGDDLQLQQVQEKLLVGEPGFGRVLNFLRVVIADRREAECAGILIDPARR